jgi:hypothetical protein
MIRNPLRVRKHLNSQTDQHVGRVVLRRGQRTEAKHKDRSAKHVFKIDPASTEFRAENPGIAHTTRLPTPKGRWPALGATPTFKQHSGTPDC